MNESVLIRTCTKKDVDILVSLGIRTFRETFEAVNTPENMEAYLNKTFTSFKLSSELDETGSLFFIAEANGLPLGYAKVRASKKLKDLDAYSAIEIERLYALKDHIGKGIGKKLMQACLDYAMQSGYDMAWLGVWEHNERAISFYEKWGFVKFSQHIFMLGNDPQTDLLMKKKLI